MSVSTVATDRLARMGLAAIGAPSTDDPVQVWESLLAEDAHPSLARRAAELDLDQVVTATEAAGARFVVPGDDEWPAGLAALGQDQPLGIWVAGESLLALMGPITLTGARACTTYGEHAAVTLASDLAMEGHTVLTGGAYGIDAAATRGALGVGGHAVIIAASGIDVPHPSAHARLWDRTRATGTVLTEQPPGTRPTRWSFLARARILAALSDAVVVVEAATRSGALQAADWAHRLGRRSYAVPGPVTSALSTAPHRLIREGRAVLATSASDILQTIDTQKD